MSLIETSPLAACDHSTDRRDGSSPGEGGQGLLQTMSLEGLYREHGARLRRLLARRVGRDEASDLVQEAFAKLAGMIATAKAPVAKPEAFVTTVATNILRDRARAASRRALQHHDLAALEVAHAADPHRLIESRAALKAIERALSLMHPRRRRIFMLHRHELLTYREIARVVGMSEKGVKKQMAKALVELRTAVERPE